MTSAVQPLVSIEHLAVDYRHRDGWRSVIRGLDLSIAPGEVVGLAGESGCGKSTLAALLLGERQAGRRLRAGRVLFDGADLAALSPRDLRRLRARRLAIVPQNGGASLTPTHRIGRLFAEVLFSRGSQPAAEYFLREVGLPDPAAALRLYPHQFSGGQQQRIALALALAQKPDLLVLDEPTTGQDAITRRAIIGLLGRLKTLRRTAMLFVSHDLATLGEISDRLAIMYAGDIVEHGPADDILAAPRHPYTCALVASLPRLDTPPDPDAILTGGLDRQALPPGCLFAPRCGFAEPACGAARPPAHDRDGGHAVLCRRWPEIDARQASAEQATA